jgi:hypothetical protein
LVVSVHVVQDKQGETEEVAELPRLPGSDILGYGYDATREYANAECVTLPIFNLGEFDTIIVAPNGVTYSLPAVMKRYLTLADMSRDEYRCMSGETAEEYRKQLNVLANVSASYMLFSGSVKTQFDRQELASINHSFVTLYHHYSGWKLGLVEIYKLATSMPRQKELEAAFAEYTRASDELVPDNTPLLEVMVFTSGELVGTDAGSGASMDLAVYRTVPPG